jgi:anaerobic selenocysteine-containing dehydrogenase
MATHHHTCPLCEATCGLTITTEGANVVSVRGDADDVFSRGFICPKGVALRELHHDPDRLTTPLVRRDGELVPATFEEAFAEVERRLPALIAEHGRNAVAVYLGNPVVHDHAATLYAPVLIHALGTDNRFSASTVDQMPKQLASGLMFGTPMSVAIPDVDHTDYLLVLGANPLVSNGSLFTAPDMPARLRALRKRGGKLVVVDPRRTRTAKAADEHVAIRPATDALLLAAMAQTLFEEDLVDLGRLAPHVNGLETVAQVVAPYAPETVAEACGIEADVIRRLAREVAAAPSAGRVRADRHLHHRVRHSGQLAGRRPERADREPRPAGWRALPQAGRRCGEHDGPAGARARGAGRRAAEDEGARGVERARRVPRRDAGRGDRHA